MNKLSNPSPPASNTHYHCEGCDGGFGTQSCDGIQAREVLPSREPAPQWIRQARMEGRAEFVDLLLTQSPETFLDDYASEHPNGESGDYSVEWNAHALANLFEVNESARSLIERIEGTYWTQQMEIEELQKDRARLDWLENNPNAIQRGEQGSFVYWPEGRAMITGSTLRDVIDKAQDDEEGARVYG